MSDSKRRPGIRTDEADAARVTGATRHDVLRDAFALWATGVAVVTLQDETGIHGLTVSAFTPVSIDPPRVLVCIGNDASILTHLQDAGRFTVNILSAEQKRAANTFSDRYAVALPPFLEGDDAVIRDGLASLVCVVEQDLDGGDHRIITGRVTAVHATEAGSPLLRFDRSYRTLG